MFQLHYVKQLPDKALISSIQLNPFSSILCGSPHLAPVSVSNSWERSAFRFWYAKDLAGILGSDFVDAFHLMTQVDSKKV